jgi:hypothetical protein
LNESSSIEKSPYDRSDKSAVLIGRPGVFTPAGDFPVSNVIIAADRYSYEGNWLFCTFDGPEILAARIGFGLGEMDWRDYGLQNAPISDHALFRRIEIVTSTGIYAYFVSDSEAGATLKSHPNRFEVRFRENQQDLIRLTGWPQTHWHFQNSEGTLATDLVIHMNQMTVWPDFLMPNNTFGVCVGFAAASGTISLEGESFLVSGAAVFDHPRIVVQPNRVAPFGWYLYCPVRFGKGIQLACYYSEDQNGQRDDIYSAGMAVLKNGKPYWMSNCEISQLSLDEEGLPLAWNTHLQGDGCSASFSVTIRQLPLKQGWGAADPSVTKGKYVAYPLLMNVEGEAKFDSETEVLRDGYGIAEFLVQQGLKPKFP